MANRIYAVTLHVAETNLGTVLSALSGSSTLVSVVPTQKAAHLPTPSSSSSSAPKEGHSRFHGGKRNKGITGEDLVMQTLGSSDRVFTATEISNAFVQHGFAGNSSSPVLSRLAASGKVRALGAGKFVLPGTVLKL